MAHPKKKLDNIIENLYNSIRSLRSFLVRVKRQISKKVKAQLSIFHPTQPKGKRSQVMNATQKSSRGRFATAPYALFAIALAVAISACGSGGGGGTTTPPAAPVTGSVTKATTCVIPADGTSCSAQLSFATSVNPAPTAPKLVVGTTTVSTAAAATDLPVTVGNTTLAVVLSDGATVLDNTKSISGACTSGTTWDGNACKAPAVLRYTDKVYAIWTGGQLFSVTKTAVTLLVNRTQYTNGGFPLGNCWLPNSNVGILADGSVLAACQDAITLRRHYLKVNPIEQAVYEYGGAIPATLQCTENPDKSWTCPSTTAWVDVQRQVPVGAPAGSVAATQISDGWFHNLAADPRSTYFTSLSGGTQVKVRDGANADVVKALFSYSNP